MSHPDFPDLEDLPEHAVAVVRRFADSRGEVATQCERFEQLPEPDPAELRIEPVDQQARVDRLRAAVESGAAPPELIRIGRAVRSGETTYAAIVSGAADDLPVVAAARAAVRARFHQLVEDGVLRMELDQGEPAAEPPKRTDRQPPESFMESSW